MSTRSKNKIEKLSCCPSFGQVAKGCHCIQHDNWSSHSDKSWVINLLKDKGKSLSQSIEKQLREKGLLSGNFICKTCAIFAKEFFDYSSKSKTVEVNSDSSDDELEHYELTEIVEINLEIQCHAFKKNRLRDKSKVNFKPIVNLLPFTTVQSTLRMKIKEIVIRDDDGDEENTDTDLGFSELLGYLGELCSDLIYLDIKTIRCLYQDNLFSSSMNTLEFIKNRDKNL